MVIVDNVFRATPLHAMSVKVQQTTAHPAQGQKISTTTNVSVHVLQLSILPITNALLVGLLVKPVPTALIASHASPTTSSILIIPALSHAQILLTWGLTESAKNVPIIVYPVKGSYLTVHHVISPLLSCWITNVFRHVLVATIITLTLLARLVCLHVIPVQLQFCANPALVGTTSMMVIPARISAPQEL